MIMKNISKLIYNFVLEWPTTSLFLNIGFPDQLQNSVNILFFLNTYLSTVINALELFVILKYYQSIV